MLYPLHHAPLSNPIISASWKMIIHIQKSSLWKNWQKSKIFHEKVTNRQIKTLKSFSFCTWQMTRMSDLHGLTRCRRMRPRRRRRRQLKTPRKTTKRLKLSTCWWWWSLTKLSHSCCSSCWSWFQLRIGCRFCQAFEIRCSNCYCRCPSFQSTTE